MARAHLKLKSLEAALTDKQIKAWNIFRIRIDLHVFVKIENINFIKYKIVQEDKTRIPPRRSTRVV